MNLVGTDVTDKDQCIMIFNLTHSALSVQGELDDGIGVHLISTLGDSVTFILWLTGKTKGLWATEGARGANLTGYLVSSLDDSLAGGLSLSDNVYKIILVRMDGL